MSDATQNLPDDPAFLKAMIATLQAQNARMSATLQAHDQLIQTLRLRIAKLKKQVFGKGRAGNRTTETGAGGSFDRRIRRQHKAA